LGLDFGGRGRGGLSLYAGLRLKNELLTPLAKAVRGRREAEI
jgi:hypothetical protein